MKLLKRYYQIIKKISHPAKIYVIHKQKYQKEAPSSIRVKASYMAEAAVVLPVFVTFMLFLLFFFRILQIQQIVGSALVNSSRKLAVMEGAADKEKTGYSNMAAGISSAEIIFRGAIKGEEALDFISGGAYGVRLLASDFKGDYITLRADYTIKIPIGILKVREVAVHQCAKSRKWTGQTADVLSDSNQMVYITKYGTVYHSSKSCTYLRPSVKKIMGSEVGACRNLDGAKYYACIKCVKKEKPNVFVYITDYGNRYHNVLRCSELERMIYMIKLSEVGSRHACSKCGKE